MVYMGSKRRYAKYIVPIIQKYIKDNNIEMFVDCFCGGANLIDKIDCNYLIANDLSPSLIALHQQAQKDFSVIPTDGNREYWDKAYAEWKKVKGEWDEHHIIPDTEMPLYEIGAIEWYSSFANGGFPRGYAKNAHGRNYYQEAYRNHKAQAAADNYKKINFIQGDYRVLLFKLPSKGEYGALDTPTLFYCDSPYKGTKPYAINPKFNHEEYYNWLRETSKKVPIFISEQEMPDDFTIVWEKEAKRTAGLDNNFKACEKLYFIDNREKKEA
jgi:DNA adenine methylase